ncbi:hypothetical protein Tco_0569814 [Tanacetum coccineum]
MVINSPCLTSKKELAIPEQTTTGKESTNPLMADSLPKTIVPTKLVKPQGFNLRPNIGIEFMHDYEILDSPRAVVFRDKYGMQMIMRFNEIHKFSDGTLQQIDEALDYQQAVHVCYLEEVKAQKNLPELGELCWWKNTRRRLQTSSENRMMTSSL